MIEFDHDHPIKCTVCNHIQGIPECIKCPCGRIFCNNCNSEIPKDMIISCEYGHKNGLIITVTEQNKGLVRNS